MHLNNAQISTKHLKDNYIKKDTEVIRETGGYAVSQVGYINYKKGYEVFRIVMVNKLNLHLGNHVTMNEAHKVLMDNMISANRYYGIMKELDDLNIELSKASTFEKTVTIKLYNTIDNRNGTFENKSNAIRKEIELTIRYNPLSNKEISFMKRLVKRLIRRTHNANRLIKYRSKCK